MRFTIYNLILIIIATSLIKCNKKNEESEFTIQISEIEAIDTSSILIEASIGVLKNVTNFQSYGFIVTHSSGKIDTLVVGENKFLQFIYYEIKNLERNAEYDIKAFAIDQLGNSKVSDSKHESTIPFILDSLKPNPIYPGNTILLYGSGLSDVDESTIVTFKKSNTTIGSQIDNNRFEPTIIEKGYNYLELQYLEEDAIGYFNYISEKSSKLNIWYKNKDYESRNSITLISYKPTISSIDELTLKAREKLNLNGQFGINFQEISVRFIGNQTYTTTPIEGGTSYAFRYHYFQRLSVPVPDEIEPGEYEIIVEIGSYQDKADEMITIIE